MLKPQTLRPMLIVNLCFFLLHWGGLSSIKPYLVHVLQNFGLGEAASWTTVNITEVKGGGGSSRRVWLCSFFWVISRRLNFMCRRFGTDSVPKRRHIKFRRREVTINKQCNIQNTAKVLNQEGYG